MIRSRAACRDILIFSRNGSSRRRTTFNTSCITSKTARVVRTSVNSGGGATGRGAAQSRCILMSDTRQHDQHDAALSKPSHNIIAAAPTTTVRYYSALPFRSSSKACVLHHTDPSCTTIAYTDFHPPWPARPAVARAAGASITSRRCMATTGTSTVDDERERNDIPTKPKKRGRPRKPKAAEQHTGSTSASAANTQSSANTSGAKNKVATLGKPRRQGK
ncbi:unnamed protein product, partial [Sphacelaria rigidula]